jgi:amidophosphoribosyltransferase
MGSKLAEKILREYPDHDIDVIIPIPDTSRSAALQLSYDLGVKYQEGFIKNRYIGRTFIMPGQKQRKKSVRQKLNAIDIEFKDKTVLLVDDSIVRGTTSQQIVQMAREAGAKKVYFASAAPPVRYPNVYGIDMPSPDEFVAHERNVKQIADELGVDWLIYQELDDLIDAVDEDKQIASFDTSCFDGEYITGDIDASYLYYIDALRNDHSKQQTDKSSAVLEIHNDD